MMVAAGTKYDAYVLSLLCENHLHFEGLTLYIHTDRQTMFQVILYNAKA